MPPAPKARPARRKPTPPVAQRERSNAKGEATRELILVTAEELFAERGIAAVPLRDIGLAAGQKNNIAVQYHFGDRETLIAEITSYRAHRSDEIRTHMIADLFAEQGQPEMRDLIATFVVPLAAHFEEGNHYLAFLSRYIIYRGGYGGFEHVAASGAVRTLAQLIRRRLPDAPPTAFQERWAMTMTGAVHTLARYQTLMKTNSLPAPIDELVDDLVTFLAAGIEAPYRVPSTRGDEVVELLSHRSR